MTNLSVSHHRFLLLFANGTNHLSVEGCLTWDLSNSNDIVTLGLAALVKISCENISMSKCNTATVDQFDILTNMGGLASLR